MIHPLLRFNTSIFRLAVFAAGVALAGCEHTEPVQQPQTPVIAVVEAAQVKNSEAVKPLDLSLDKIAGEFVESRTPDAEPGNPLIKPARKDEARIELGGNLLTDANVEDYVDSVDGAAVNITIKTR